MADISKITLPNGSSYDIKDATARAGKQNIRNGTVSGNVNWDTLTTAGTYKIQNTTMKEKQLLKKMMTGEMKPNGMICLSR